MRRNYESSLASALDNDNIPVQVYTSLVDGVNANLATFYRYLNLRKRMLGVDHLALLRSLRAGGKER